MLHTFYGLSSSSVSGGSFAYRCYISAWENFVFLCFLVKFVQLFWVLHKAVYDFSDQFFFPLSHSAGHLIHVVRYLSLRQLPPPFVFSFLKSPAFTSLLPPLFSFYFFLLLLSSSLHPAVCLRLNACLDFNGVTSTEFDEYLSQWNRNLNQHSKQEGLDLKPHQVKASNIK